MKTTMLSKIAVVGLASLALAACGASEAEIEAPPASDSIDWKQFEGEKITLLFNAHPWTDAMEARMGEFQELTGIEVDLQTYSEDLYWDRYASALRADKGVADVYFQSMDDTAFSDFENDLIAPLGDFIESDSLTADDYDVQDFPTALIEAAQFPFGTEDAQPYGIPIVSETFILYYNEDHVETYLDGQVPETMEDLIAAVDKVKTESDGEIAGAAVRGIRSAGIRDPLTSVVLNAYGDAASVQLPENVWFDGGFDSPRLDDPAIVEGVADYASLVAAGPSNALSLDWPDATALFGQGRAAFMIDSTAFSPTFEDEEQSLVAGKVGYAPIPESERGRGTGVASWGLGIPANSENKEAAWLFIQWATNKFNTVEFSKATGGAARVSAAEDSDYLAALNPDFAKATAAALQNSTSSAVYREGWSEQMLIIVDAMQAIVGGADAQSTMADANAQLKKSLNL